jgi:cell shape-determining protein MreD
LVLTGFLSASFKARWIPFSYFPDPGPVFCVWLAFRYELHLSAPGLFLAGFLLDGLTLAPTGGGPLNLVLMLLSARLLGGVLDFSASFYMMCLTLFIFFLSNLAIYPLLIYISYGNPTFNVIPHNLATYCVQGALTALAAPPVFAFLDGAGPKGE